MLVDADTGAPADPVQVDRGTGRPLIGPHYKLVPGPVATEATITRLATRSTTPLPTLASKECTA